MFGDRKQLRSDAVPVDSCDRLTRQAGSIGIPRINFRRFCIAPSKHRLEHAVGRFVVGDIGRKALSNGMRGEWPRPACRNQSEILLPRPLIENGLPNSVST